MKPVASPLLRCLPLALLLGCLAPASAGASPAPAPHLSAHVVALPSRFAVGDSTDQYELLVTNTGGAATSTDEGRPVVVRLASSPNLTVTAITGVEWGGAREVLHCTEKPAIEPIECRGFSAVQPDETLAIRVEVSAEAAGTATSEVSVGEGGTTVDVQTLETPIAGVRGEPVTYAVESFSFGATALDGAFESQAGAHPYEQSTSFELPSTATSSPEQAFRPAKNPRFVTLTLPDGFVGNPLQAPRCPPRALQEVQAQGGQLLAPCPSGSLVGFITLLTGRSGGAAGTFSGNGDTSAVYNLIPEAGHAAELGFSYDGFAVFLYLDVVFEEGRYRLRVAIPGTPIVDLDGLVLTLFGDPGAHGEQGGLTGAFLTNPSVCTDEPLAASLQLDSWESPGEWIEARASAFPRVEGCDLQSFDPQLRVEPEADSPGPSAGSVQADSPDGYEVSLKVPNAETPWPALASPAIRNATILLPAGISLSPSAANGLEGCSESGPGGIDFPRGAAHPDEAGEGEAIGPDGLSRLTEGACPSKSILGTVEVTTPLVGEPLSGHLYLATPSCGEVAPCTPHQVEDGEMVRVFLEAQASGIDLKLRGAIEVGGSGPSSGASGLAPGQLRLRLLESPQLPVSEIDVRTNGGPRALLASPQSCSPLTAVASIEPWSGISRTATASDGFDVVGCSSVEPFAPDFSSGTVLPVAGGSSPFTIILSRRDGEQGLGGLSVAAPPGVAAVLAAVRPCGVAIAQSGDCQAASSIGHVDAAIGVGSEPYWVHGQAYLTAPYRGAPFGVALVLPADLGPFKVGRIVVLAALRVDRTTGALTIATDRLPQNVDGIPLRTRQLVISIDRPGFMVDPTNCSRTTVSGVATGALPDGSSGSSVAVGSNYHVVGCRGLPFAPKIVATVAGRATRAGGASLKVIVTASPGEANIGKVKVDLPRQLPARQSTLRKACPAAVFAANPAGCPRGSLVGTAQARTPLLRTELSGPAYLVSHGGQKFPDLSIVLQAEGIEIVLTGATSIRRGVTSSAFRAVPDERFEQFELTLPRGPHSLLGSFVTGRRPQDLCGRRMRMPNLFTGQNGAVVKRATKVSVSGCHMRKPAHRAKRRPAVR